MRLTQRLHLHILTGFLGSGKSTLLRRYLHSTPGADKAIVLINEFGAVAIDHTLVRAVSPHGRSLTGGCACCEGDDALRDSLLSILTQIQRGDLPGVEDIILETSGVADPSRIIGTIAAEMHLGEYIDTKSCVTVVEAGTTHQFAKRFPELRNQIACANKVAISKGDQHDSEELAATASLIRELNPLCEIIPITETTDLTSLLTCGGKVPSTQPLQGAHHTKFSTFQIEVDPLLSWPSFSVWLTGLLHRHGSNILRFKGIIPLDTTAGYALVLQGVRHRVYEPEHLDIASDENRPGYGLVFICEGEYETAVRESLRRFEANYAIRS